MIHCPHCRLLVQVSPQLAGQMLACPGCGGRFVVPAPPFDPYYTWLGIPPAEQPANCYRLLGIGLFEANPAVIENAADRQMRHLQSFKSGPHAALSQRLLNEVAAARVALLDPQQRARYDAQLHQSLAAVARAIQPPAASQSAPTTPIAGTTASFSAPASFAPAMSATPRMRYTNRRPRSALTLVMLVAGGLLGVMMGVLAVFYLTGQDLLGWNGKLREGLVSEASAETSPSRPAAVPPAPRPAPVATGQAAGSSSNLAATRAATSIQNSTAGNVEKPPAPAATAEQQVSDDSRRTFADLIHPKPPPIPPPPNGKLANGFEACALPPLDSTDPVRLIEISDLPLDGLSILDGAADLPPAGRISIEPRENEQVWTVGYTPDAEAQVSRTALCVIRRQQQGLMFAWSLPLADAKIRAQVANCLLEVVRGNEKQMFQLRQPVMQRGLVLDLEKTRQVEAVSLPALPLSTKIRLRMGELIDFPSGGKLPGNVRLQALSRPFVIEFDGLKGPEVRVMLHRPALGDKVELRLQSLFKETSKREFELTFAALEKDRSEHDQRLTKTQSEYDQVKRNFDQASATLQRWLGNPTAYAPNLTAWETQVAKMRTTVAALTARMNVLGTQIADCRQRLDAVPKVRSFLDAVHRKAVIPYAVVAQCDDKEIILVEARPPVLP
jgi:hypothetical protein